MAARKLKKGSGPLAKLDLGRVDMCLNVKDIARSQEFYQKLGFREVEGDPDKHWLVIEKGRFRVGLFQGFIPQNTINFRGGHIKKIVGGLQAAGLEPYDVHFADGDGTGNAMLKDPDGNAIFFDTTAKELQARKAALKRRE